MAAGILAGLGLASRWSIPTLLPLAGAGFLLLVAWLPARRSGARSVGGVGGTLAACAVAGLALGTQAGRTALGACTADLEDGDAVEALGVAARTLPAGLPPPPGGRGPPPASTVRLRLVDVRLRADRRTCRVPALLARVRPVAGVEAGDPVRVAGRWWAYGAEGPAPPHRRGLIRGRVEPPGAHAPGPSGWALEHPPGRRFTAGLRRLRAAAARRVSRRVPRDVEPLARALTLAERDDVAPALSRRFADAGLAHLLAISGLHVGVLAGGALWILGRIVRRRERYVAAALLVAGYVLFIGAPPAAVRAAVLFGGWAAGRTLGWPVRGTELLGAAALLTLVADPLALRAAGFQLSFAGFAGLLLGDALAERGLEAAGSRGWRPGRRGRRAIRAVAAGAGAFALTAPFAALHFQRAAPVAVLSNFAGVPLVSLALAGLAGALLLPGPAGALAGDGAGVMLRVLVRVVDVVAGLPWGHGSATPPGPLQMVAAGLLVVGLAGLARGLPAARAAPPAAAAVALWLVAPVAYLAAPGPSAALLCQLDVGQGDAAVLRTRAGHWIVFDAGPGGRGPGRGEGPAGFIRSRGGRAVELFVLSHPHADHLGGSEALLRSLRAGRVLDAGVPVASEGYAGFLDRLAEEGAAWLPARPGDRLRVEEVEILVLAAGGVPSSPGDPNEASVAVRVRIGDGFVYLNTGDAYVAQERGMLSRWPADSLRAVLLKAGHHGSRTSTSPEWLEAVAPRMVVISAGAGNRYGHPHPEVLRRLEDAGEARVWRTDLHGTLCLEVSPDGRWRIRGEAAPAARSRGVAKGMPGPRAPAAAERTSGAPAPAGTPAAPVAAGRRGE